MGSEVTRFDTEPLGNAKFSRVEPGGILKKYLLNLSSIVLLSFLASCVVSPKIINGPDGTPHHLVSCSYIESCYESATEVCGGKYKIVNTSNEVSGDAQSTSSTTNLLVKCSNNFYKQLRSGNTSPGKNHQTIAAGSIGRAALTNAIDIAAVACVGRGLAAAGEVLRARHSRSAHKA